MAKINFSEAKNANRFPWSHNICDLCAWIILMNACFLLDLKTLSMDPSRIETSALSTIDKFWWTLSLIESMSPFISVVNYSISLWVFEISLRSDFKSLVPIIEIFKTSALASSFQASKAAYLELEIFLSSLIRTANLPRDFIAVFISIICLKGSTWKLGFWWEVNKFPAKNIHSGRFSGLTLLLPYSRAIF